MNIFDQEQFFGRYPTIEHAILDGWELFWIAHTNKDGYQYIGLLTIERGKKHVDGYGFKDHWSKDKVSLRLNKLAVNNKSNLKVKKK